MKRNEAIKFVYAVILALVLFISPNYSSSYIINSDTSSADLLREVTANQIVPPVIYHPDNIDRDFDRIEDGLENMISQIVALNSAAFLPVVVTLYDPVVDHDIEYFKMFGGRFTYVYNYVTYGLAGSIPAVNISRFAEIEGGNLCIIEYDAPVEYHLDVSVPLVRTRPILWDTYGYMGSANYSIAIIDTGIDDTHSDTGPYGDRDFSKKIVGWYDATEDNSSTPEDYGEHGTHVAGIAAGTGVANSLQGSGEIKTTFTYILPPERPGPGVYGYVDYIDVANPGVIKLNCSWEDSNTVLLVLSDPAGNEVERTSGTVQPLILIYNTTSTAYPTGRYEAFVGNVAGPPDTPFSCIEAYPYQGRNDGYNLFTGVAPNSKLVGVKVFDNTGSGSTSTVMAAMEWVIQNRFDYHITVASMSLGLQRGGVDITIDQKVDTMVKNGIVTTVSAGNDYPDYTIGSPGTAAYVITVAATNDQNGITDYSSNGDILKNEYGLIKPDVAAPGGTFHPEFGNHILSVDSNDLDAKYSSYKDRNVNDYQQMAGTSMSTPHVAGLSALLVQAFGGWNWTLDEVLKVKMIISMTSFEVQSGEGTNMPPLNRGEKDEKEGYGRIAADAAIEAATLNYSVGELAVATLGCEPSDKKVWARQGYLQEGKTCHFNLSVPSGSDYDLYLYDGNPDEHGQPLILEKSINASLGMRDIMSITPEESGIYYLVVKWVSGSGAFTLESSIKKRNLAVLDVVPSVREAFEGWIVNISVTVKNLGELAETFNTTAYFDSSVVDVMQVTDLSSDNSVTIVFTWNTTGLLPANYTISATTEPVQGETDILDNTLIDGAVRIRLQGDANDDDILDVFDALQTLAAFNVYDPDCDFNGDGVMNLIDALILMNAF